MGIAELQSQIGAWECGIRGKQASISSIDAKVSAIEEARRHAIAARDEAESLVRTASYFALAGWTGNHATAFMNAMGPGGGAREEAAAMHQRCIALVESMDAQLRSLSNERGALQGSIARDRNSIEQARRSVNRLRKEK